MRSKQKHMSKFSSGKRVEKSTDDAGALGVKHKQARAIRRMRGVNQNLQNALSYAQMQEYALGSNSARLTSEITALDVDFVHKETSLGRIEDVDMALTASRLAKAEIKMQAATSIFVQANALFAQRNYVDEQL